MQFIERSQHQPFLLYLAHPMPHIPIYPGKEFQSVSDAGLYGDAVEEIDWCTGLISGSIAVAGPGRAHPGPYTPRTTGHGWASEISPARRNHSEAAN